MSSPEQSLRSRGAEVLIPETKLDCEEEKIKNGGKSDLRNDMNTNVKLKTIAFEHR